MCHGIYFIRIHDDSGKNWDKNNVIAVLIIVVLFVTRCFLSQSLTFKIRDKINGWHIFNIMLICLKCIHAYKLTQEIQFISFKAIKSCDYEYVELICTMPRF